jgi:hypothetical protein
MPQSRKLANYGAPRLPWFSRPAHDWISDPDNGGDGMNTKFFFPPAGGNAAIVHLPP